jgi:hypothetical protein
VAPRSGLANKHGIDTLAGVIDADYRGPVGVILANLSDVDFEVKVGDRIAQLIVEKVRNVVMCGRCWRLMVRRLSCRMWWWSRSWRRVLGVQGDLEARGVLGREREVV